MIIIFGIRRLRKSMGPVMLRCANCGMSPLALLRVSTWFALFFIPLIPVSFKHYTACPNCKRVDQVPKTEVDRARAQETAVKTAGGDGTPDVASQPVTLEHAVNQWASADRAHAGALYAAPAAPAPLAPGAAPPPLAPAGWYPDPAAVAGQRYWDGQRWTEQTTPTQLSP